MAIFVTLQKNAFGENSNFMHGFKSANLEKLTNFQVSMNASNTWKGKLEVASFFAI
jgi:hypothetical protein